MMSVGGTISSAGRMKAQWEIKVAKSKRVSAAKQKTLEWCSIVTANIPS